MFFRNYLELGFWILLIFTHFIYTQYRKSLLLPIIYNLDNANKNLQIFEIIFKTHFKKYPQYVIGNILILNGDISIISINFLLKESSFEGRAKNLFKAGML